MSTRACIPLPSICLAVALATGVGCRANGGEGTVEIKVTCGVDLGLNVENTSRKDWSGQVRAWSAEAHGDTLVVTRSGRCGDECSFAETIVLVGPSGECPKFVSAVSRRRDAGSPVRGAGTVVEARRGTLAIQDWNPPNGIVSGRLVSELTTSFYVDLGKDR